MSKSIPVSSCAYSHTEDINPDEHVSADRLDDAMETVEMSFRRTTIAELLNASEGRAPLCERAGVVALDCTVTNKTLR